MRRQEDLLKVITIDITVVYLFMWHGPHSWTTYTNVLTECF